MGGIDPSKSGTIRFDAYELDARTCELRKDGIRVKVQGQPLQILQILRQAQTCGEQEENEQCGLHAFFPGKYRATRAVTSIGLNGFVM